MWRRRRGGGRLTLEVLRDYPTNTNSGSNLDHSELIFSAMDEGQGGVTRKIPEGVSVCI